MDRSLGFEDGPDLSDEVDGAGNDDETVGRGFGKGAIEGLMGVVCRDGSDTGLRGGMG